MEKEPAMKNSRHLVADAKEGIDDCPALWLRGLLPRAWVEAVLSKYPPEGGFSLQEF